MKKKKLTEEEIDEIVIAEANDSSAWGKEIKVKANKTISLRLANKVIKKTKFFSRLHKAKGYQTWIKKIIEDRLKLEEEIYYAVRTNKTSEKVF